LGAIAPKWVKKEVGPHLGPTTGLG